MKSILNKGIILIAGLLISQVLTGQFSHQLQGDKLPWTKTPQVKDNNFRFVIISDLTGGEKEGVFTIGVDGQVGVQQIEVVEPVIDPVPFPKLSFETQFSLGDGSLDKSLGRHRQADPPIEDCFQKLAGREGASQQRAQFLRAVDQMKCGRQTVRWDDEAAAINRQRIVAIGLDQPQEGQHLRVTDGGIQQHVAAPILVDVAIAGIALRVELRRQIKSVVVALEIAVPATVQMVDVAIQLYRPAAAQDVVQQALPAVSIETGVAGLCSNRIGKSLS